MDIGECRGGQRSLRRDGRFPEHPWTLAQIQSGFGHIARGAVITVAEGEVVHALVAGDDRTIGRVRIGVVDRDPFDRMGRHLTGAANNDLELVSFMKMGAHGGVRVLFDQEADRVERAEFWQISLRKRMFRFVPMNVVCQKPVPSELDLRLVLAASRLDVMTTIFRSPTSLS